MIIPKHILFDGERNALDYLCHACQYIEKVESNPTYWKWVVISLHGAIYGFAVAACRGTDDSSVIDSNGKLISFNEAIRRCCDKNIMSMTVNSKHLQMSPRQSSAIRILKKHLRNNFEHFQSQSWLLEIHGMPQISISALQVVSFLALETGNYVHLTNDEKRDLQLMVSNAISILESSELHKEAKILEGTAKEMIK